LSQAPWQQSESSVHVSPDWMQYEAYRSQVPFVQSLEQQSALELQLFPETLHSTGPFTSAQEPSTQAPLQQEFPPGVQVAPSARQAVAAHTPPAQLELQQSSGLSQL
jgi:hypothetical protein